MKLTIYTFALISLLGLNLKAQDMVTTTGNTNDVYYSMNNKVVSTVSNSNWDLAFEIKGFTGSVLINDGNGLQVFSAPYSVADWAKFDSTGFKGWTSHINSLTNWSVGALSQNPSSQFDLGWGQYDISTHAVVGDSVFLLVWPNGSAKKMYVKDLTAGKYTFVYADVDGSNEQTKTLLVSDYANKNFGYFSFDTEANLNREPDTKAWDIVFTKYIMPIPVGGGMFQNYPVGGVKINKGVEVAQRNGKSVTDNDTMGLNWSTDITEIGSDWKQFDGTTYVIAPDQVYFLRTLNGAVWKIYFTDYKGGADANYYFNSELIAQSVGVEEAAMKNVNIYPNPLLSGQDLQISVPAEIAISKMFITDINGAVLKSFEPQSAININAKPGVYHLHMVTEAGTVVKPIIIQ